MRAVLLNKELFDGSEGDFIDLKSTLTVGSDKIEVSFEDFSNNDFRSLESSLSQADVDKLVKDFDLRPFVFDGNVYYNDRRGLKIYYCIKGKHLVILSFGETQPTRYEIFVLGVASMN